MLLLSREQAELIQQRTSKLIGKEIFYKEQKYTITDIFRDEVEPNNYVLFFGEFNTDGIRFILTLEELLEYNTEYLYLLDLI